MAVPGSVLCGLVQLFGLRALATTVMARRIEARYPPCGRFVEPEHPRLEHQSAGCSDGTGTALTLFEVATDSSEK
jgi:hypothetical protein